MAMINYRGANINSWHNNQLIDSNRNWDWAHYRPSGSCFGDKDWHKQSFSCKIQYEKVAPNWNVSEKITSLGNGRAWLGWVGRVKSTGVQFGGGDGADRSLSSIQTWRDAVQSIATVCRKKKRDGRSVNRLICQAMGNRSRVKRYICSIPVG